ncbi:VOC family protein [Nitrobacter winogradskyi]|uniref:VOC family protein n=1 Tax=Nitrobacter winogradskyi TaxID=913 RepID=UPI0002DCED51|nr:VOC family protein [Nitrobacter winogradskyi]
MGFTYGDPVFCAGVERDEVTIHLQAARKTQRRSGRGAVNVFATEVDALHDELRSRGVAIVHPPGDRPYGMRDFEIYNLDGNRLTFGMGIGGSD